MQSRSHAEAYGNALLAKLGPGWALDVWENIGWHYRAQISNLYLSEHFDREGKPYYMTLMGDGSHPGAGMPGWSGRGDTPEEAIAMSLAAAQRDIEHRATAAAKVATALAGEQYEPLPPKAGFL